MGNRGIRTIWLYGPDVAAEKKRATKDLSGIKSSVSDSVTAFGGRIGVAENIRPDTWCLYVQVPSWLVRLLIRLRIL